MSSGRDVTVGPSEPSIQKPSAQKQPARRDFLVLATGSLGAVGLGLTAWPFIDSMNPSADVTAFSRVEIELEAIEKGQRVTVKWRGRPVFVDRRTEQQIARAVADDTGDLKDPESDTDRVQKPEWLIVIGVCTHLGCIPLGQRQSDPRGDWGGWFCPCHGSHYDVSGRIRKGPAPKNLVVPPYMFLSEEKIRIG